MVVLFCGDLFFMLQNYIACQEKAVEQTFVVDCSRLLSFAVGYIFDFQMNKKIDANQGCVDLTRNTKTNPQHSGTTVRK